MDKQFNSLKLRSFLIDKLGKRSFSDFYTNAKIDNSSFSRFVTENSGRVLEPSAKQWNRIIAEFNRRNIHVKKEFFYDGYEADDKKSYSSDNPLGSVKEYNWQEHAADLLKELSTLRDLIREKDELILKQDNDNRKLKRENNQLKKRLKELGDI
ncbi:MAG: hypothetical protein LUE98_11945 [Tannerellaceae bacterium]|nr:hypothetical protein [Tannerellaceae bacterium]